MTPRNPSSSPRRLVGPFAAAESRRFDRDVRERFGGPWRRWRRAAQALYGRLLPWASVRRFSPWRASGVLGRFVVLCDISHSARRFEQPVDVCQRAAIGASIVGNETAHAFGGQAGQALDVTERHRDLHRSPCCCGHSSRIPFAHGPSSCAAENHFRNACRQPTRARPLRSSRRLFLLSGQMAGRMNLGGGKFSVISRRPPGRCGRCAELFREGCTHLHHLI